MASLLFIAPSDLGEAVLATGALDHALTRLDGPKTTIVCHPDARDLYRATPNLEALIADEGVAFWLSVARRAFVDPFDTCIDLMDTPAVHAISAHHRYSRSPSRVNRATHVCAAWAR